MCKALRGQSPLPDMCWPMCRDLFWESHYSKIAMDSFEEETDRHLPEYSLPEQIESLIEKGKYSNVENRVTKDNYKRRMHNLLYLEEYQQRLDMSRSGGDSWASAY